MGEDQRTGSSSVNESQDPEEIRAEIDETRRELGETVAALSAKTDVKAQAQERVDELKATVTEKKDEFAGKAQEISPESVQAAASAGATKARENPVPVAAIAAFAVGFVLGRVSSR